MYTKGSDQRTHQYMKAAGILHNELANLKKQYGRIPLGETSISLIIKLITSHCHNIESDKKQPAKLIALSSYILTSRLYASLISTLYFINETAKKPINAQSKTTKIMYPDSTWVHRGGWLTTPNRLSYKSKSTYSETVYDTDLAGLLDQLYYRLKYKIVDKIKKPTHPFDSYVKSELKPYIEYILDLNTKTIKYSVKKTIPAIVERDVFDFLICSDSDSDSNSNSDSDDSTD